MYRCLRPLLFSLSPELSHDFTLSSLAIAGRSGLLKKISPEPINDETGLMGLRFRNRVGLAAGLDKNAECIPAWEALGFGVIQVGTVTPLHQVGNPKPRMFRLPEHQSIINRMGFNNHGLEALVSKVKRARAAGIEVPLGINIGKNKNTRSENAVDDYLVCLEAVYPLADYVTVNLSSPNTPGLRDLQFGEALDQLLVAITGKRKFLANKISRKIPLLVKIAPDMADDDLRSVVDRLVQSGIEGVIATNTTIDRSTVEGSPYAKEAGGLSGEALHDRSTRVVRLLADHLQGEMTIVGVGGICSSRDAKDKIDAGADLVQLYSGLVYRGPSLIHEVAAALKRN